MHHHSSHSTGGVFGWDRRPNASSGSPSISSSRTEFSRKASFSSSSKSPKFALHQGRKNSLAPHPSLEKRKHHIPTTHTDNTPLPAIPLNWKDTDLGPRSADSFKQVVAKAEAAVAAHNSALRRGSDTSTTPYSNMLVRPGTGYQSIQSNGAGPTFAPMQPLSPTLETITYQHIQETSSKRISTLDYLRKA